MKTQLEVDVDAYREPRYQYSQLEVEMLSRFISPGLLSSVEPFVAYRMAAETAFLKDMQGPHVESLRRTFNAFMEMTCYRLTPKWDEMIVLGEESAK